MTVNDEQVGILETKDLQPEDSPMDWLEKTFSLPRPQKRVLQILADSAVVSIGLMVALLLKFDDPSAAFSAQLPITLLIALPPTLFVFVKLGLYRMIVRYVGPRALFTIMVGALVATGVLAAAAKTFGLNPPIAVYPIFFLLVLVSVGGIRLYMRWLSQRMHAPGWERVAIYGAGNAGKQLFHSLENSGRWCPVVFIDDNPLLQGTSIDGIPVISLDDFRHKTVCTESIGRILLAIPSISHQQRREILDRLTPVGKPVMLMPGIEDLVSGRARINDLREVTVDDLLGRDAVTARPELLDQCIAGKTVLVTGAGGSIGSELCRQIADIGAARLLMLEISEFALYSVHQELTRSADAGRTTTEIVPLLGSVTDPHRLSQIFHTYRVDTVYHAAAYKHVPMVEHNHAEGIRNNVVGTLRLAQAARKAGVERFVLISTDKAVRPTNVMGASKRIAEMVLQAMNAESRGSTVFSMVRFGNVLGSSGSVIPLFRKQIASGGPVTVTHPEIVRYFMTIPEAVELVIQAGSMAEGGDVFVLDMGEPVKIAELAKRMIHLSGLTLRDSDHPNGEISIEFSGLRPGEKLYEELLIDDNATGTSHPKIMRAEEDFQPWPELIAQINDLEIAARVGDVEALRELLLGCARGYTPNKTIEDWLWAERNSDNPWQSDKVVALR